MKYILLTLAVLFSFSTYIEAKVLAPEDKEVIHKLVKTVLEQQYLLETKKYNNKEIKNKLLAILPEKIFDETGGYYPKQKHVESYISLGVSYKNTLVKSTQKIKILGCKYLKDNSVDCDAEDNIFEFFSEKDTPKLFESFGNIGYKFNLTMDDKGQWSINKLKIYSMTMGPKLNTLEIDKQEAQEELHPKVRARKHIADDDISVSSLPTMSMPRVGPYKAIPETDELNALEEEEEKRISEEVQEENRHYRRKMKKQNRTIPEVDQNGNRIFKRHSRHLKPRRGKRVVHPLYGAYWSYNRGKLWRAYYAVQYALDHAFNYNTDGYRTFNNDCANFVSQSLTWGGWQNDGYWYKSKTNWFYNPWYQSYTWAGAKNLKEYLDYQVEEGNAERRNIHNLRPGDVIAITNHSDDTYPSHMMMITQVKNGQYYLSAHTRNRRNEPRHKIWKAGQTFWYWGYHILRGNLN